MNVDHVYFVHAPEVRRIKIGHSTQPAGRVGCIDSQSPCKTIFLGAVPAGPITEMYLHDKFAADRFHGEWFAESNALWSLINESLSERCIVGCPFDDVSLFVNWPKSEGLLGEAFDAAGLTVEDAAAKAGVHLVTMQRAVASRDCPSPWAVWGLIKNCGFKLEDLVRLRLAEAA